MPRAPQKTVKTGPPATRPSSRPEATGKRAAPVGSSRRASGRTADEEPPREVPEPHLVVRERAGGIAKIIVASGFLMFASAHLLAPPGPIVAVVRAWQEPAKITAEALAIEATTKPLDALNRKIGEETNCLQVLLSAQLERERLSSERDLQLKKILQRVDELVRGSHSGVGDTASDYLQDPAPVVAPTDTGTTLEPRPPTADGMPDGRKLTTKPPVPLAEDSKGGPRTATSIVPSPEASPSHGKGKSAKVLPAAGPAAPRVGEEPVDQASQVPRVRASEPAPNATGPTNSPLSGAVP